MRVVADHVRSALMIIGDGVRPSNEGRGYVLRRLLRRSVRAMRLLGVDGLALPSLLPVSKDAMAPSYPELATDFEQISAVAYAEEEAFRRTLASGTTILDTAVASLKQDATAGTNLVLPGEAAFQLHDTYGFPIDLTLEMAAEQGVQVDETGLPLADAGAALPRPRRRARQAHRRGRRRRLRGPGEGAHGPRGVPRLHADGRLRARDRPADWRRPGPGRHRPGRDRGRPGPHAVLRRGRWPARRPRHDRARRRCDHRGRRRAAPDQGAERAPRPPHRGHGGAGRPGDGPDRHCPPQGHQPCPLGHAHDPQGAARARWAETARRPVRRTPRAASGSTSARRPPCRRRP